MPQFVHLHVHTQYSILDGAASISSLVGLAKEYGMPALAITDHGNMYGVMEFYRKVKGAGLKPIIGCEVYVVKNHKIPDKEEKAGDHLILLAKNITGYHNLVKMVSYSWTDGFYYKPRIDKELLRLYHDGIICCSACLGGEVPQAIMRGDLDEAGRVIEEFKAIFGEDYYLEMQLHKPANGVPINDVYDWQLKVNDELRRLSVKHGVKLIVSNDVHFALAEDSVAHDHLICLNTGKDLDDPKRMRYTGEEYFKSPDEMAALFPNDAEALRNTVEIADKVEVYELEHKPLMPNFPLPETFVTDEERVRELVLKRYKNVIKAAREKLESLRGESDPNEWKLASQEVFLNELRRRRDNAAQAESLDDFARGDEQAEEWLLISRQFLYLEHITLEGARKRYGEDLSEKVMERINYELGTIEWMGFPGYFLIVWDFIRAAREMGVAVGPGRGSAAGSVVAYALGITNIDPLKYDLLFERFLNPDRISLPDVDVDFDEDGRSDVLKYVTDKYGKKRVAQIVTFGTMAPKMAIRDVARVQKLPLTESDRLAKLVPDRILTEKGETPFQRVYKDVPDLAKERESQNEQVRNTLRYAEKLEGSIRQTGVHACGVIIGKDDLELYAPVATAKDADLNVIQYEGREVESVGLIKMDFLGLKTLSIIKDAVRNVKLTTGEPIDIDAVSLEDPKTFELFCRGETTGIFQFESAGMKKYMRALKPSRFEDLIAMNALYRPGPMDKIPNFINRKHGIEEVVYDFPEMEEYLYDTYGITVYQEQVMLLSQKLAGFTGGEADSLRKAMGKKQIETLNKLRPKFFEGARKRGHDEATLTKIWKEWEAFASYAFNKSHATCYAYVAFQTAYLKAHYPSEFMAALLSRNSSSVDKIAFFMDECKKMGINVLGPDVNESWQTFTADKTGNVRFGLTGIKGVGEGAVISIVEERESGGKYKDIFDFAERTNFSAVNKKAIENLALAGAFDSIAGFHRSRFFTVDARDANGTTYLDQLMKYGARVQAEKNTAQQSLFGGDAGTADIQKPTLPSAQEWSSLETLNHEREMIGMYLSSHPLDEYSVVLKSLCNTTLPQLANVAEIKGRDFTVGGMVTDVKNLYTKNGKPFGRFMVEDYSGQYEFVLFDKDYENFRRFMYPNYFLLIRGSVKPRTYRPDEYEVKVSSIMQLEEAKNTLLREITLSIHISELTSDMINELEKHIKRHKGNTALRFRIADSEGGVAQSYFSKRYRIEPSAEFTGFLDDYDISYSITS